MTDYKKGRIYELTIDRISQKRNGIVETDGSGHINVGRVNCEPGETVRAEYLGSGVAFCTEKEKRASSYNVSRKNGMIKTISQSGNGSGVTTDFDEADPANKNKLLNNLR